MNSSNNKWIIGVAGVLLAIFLVMGACLAGAAGGYLVARGQFNRELAELRRQAPAPIQLPERIPVQPERMPEITPFPFPEDFPFDFQLPEDLEQLQGIGNGALLQEIVPGAPAEAAGLQVGDVVTAVDGEMITPDSSLADLIMAYDPGDEITLTVVRLSSAGLEEQEIEVTLGSNPDNPERPFLGVRYGDLFFDRSRPEGE